MYIYIYIHIHIHYVYYVYIIYIHYNYITVGIIITPFFDHHPSPVGGSRVPRPRPGCTQGCHLTRLRTVVSGTCFFMFYLCIYMYLSMGYPIYASICIYICICSDAFRCCVLIYASIYLCVYVNLSVYLSIYLLIHFSIYLSMNIYLPLYLSIC